MRKTTDPKNKKSTASKHSSGKTALKFKEGTKNAKQLKNTGSSTTVQQARRKQQSEGVPKSKWVGAKGKDYGSGNQASRIANMQAEARKVLNKKK